jgi:hypothetical protein
MDLFAKLSQAQILQQRLGHVRISVAEAPALIFIEPSGYIGPTLLQKTLEFAQDFGKRHPEGWDYIVDSLHLKVPNPLNIYWLRKIRNLPNLRKYIVITPPFLPVRLIEKTVLASLVGPDMILDSKMQLNRLYEGR